MSKTALLFAGQGAQTVGMGKDLSEQHPTARALADQANAVLGHDLAGVCFGGPEEELTRTDNAQPGILLVSWMAFQLLKEQVPDLKFEATAGLSLGEFTALAAAGAISFEEGLRVVRQRGQFMQEACEATRGGMAALIGPDEAAAREICEQAGVEVANLNCPGQVVISGSTEGIARACELAKTKGVRRVMPLTVAGAYHSLLMANAQQQLEAVLRETPIAAPAVQVISNLTALPHGEPAEIRRRLVEQVTSTVRWEQSMRYLLDQGFSRFIELGPGRVLSGFLGRMTKNAQVLNVSGVDSLRNTVSAIRG